MVKKAIIIQLLILGLLAFLLSKRDFYDVRLKEAQNEIDFWKLVKKVVLDTTYFNHLDIPKGKFIIIGYGSYSNESSPLFNEIKQNQQKLDSYRIVAISPFEKRDFNIKCDSAFSQHITFKYSEMDLDVILRGIPYMTIPEYKEQREKAKTGNPDMTSDYPVVIILNDNKIVWAKRRVADFSEINLNE